MSHLERTLQSLKMLHKGARLTLQDEDAGNLEIVLTSGLTQTYNLAWWDDAFDEGFETQGTYLDAVQAVERWYKTLEQVGML